MVCKHCGQIIKDAYDPDVKFKYKHVSGYWYCNDGSGEHTAEPKEDIVAPVGMKGGIVRQFETGATRDLDTNKYDYEGFLHPLVLQRYAEYMHKHRVQKDGSLRDSDNWQKGMPLPVYMKSLYRHFMDVWKAHRETYSDGNYLEDALCGVLFNTMGYLATILKNRSYKARKESGEDDTKANESSSCANSTFASKADTNSFYRPSPSPYDLSAKRKS